MPTLDELKTRLLPITHLKSTLAILGWDQAVNMPPKGAKQRAATTGYLAGLLHTQLLDLNTDDLLTKLHEQAETGKLDLEGTAIVRELWRDYQRQQKLPAEFVTEFAELTAQANEVWQEARSQSNFAHFQPYLEKILAMSLKETELVGYQESPYDALLDISEPGMTVKQLTPVFDQLRDFLVPLISAIKASPHRTDPSLLSGHFPVERQRQFNQFLVERLGFDLEAGRLDTSAHPFSVSFQPQDVRITIRYDENNLFYSVGAAIHEAGHGIYEQGIKPENFGTPLGDAGSNGLHESQSRIWENNVGLGWHFWQYMYPELRKFFPQPFNDVDIHDFYRVINHVEPSLIRTEADEVTYNLHIILRFEIERDLIEGKLKVADLPAVWNAKMKEYLGVDVPDDAHGVLQDMHWASGFGYFPSYSLGTIYATQLYEAAKRDLPDLESQLATGDFLPFREWLRQQIHQYGKFHTTEGLIRQITGQALEPKAHIRYLKRKYSELYKIADLYDDLD